MNEGTKLAIYSAILIGLSAVVQNLATKKAEPLLVSSYALLMSSIILVVLVSVSGKKFVPLRKLKDSADFWKIVISRNVLGILLLNYGFSMTTAINSVVVLRLEPAFVAIFGYLLLKERITLKEIVYVAATIAGALLISTKGDIAFGAIKTGDILVAASMIIFGYSYIPARKITKKIDPIQVVAFSNLAGGIILMSASIIFLRSVSVSTEALGLITISVMLFHVLGLTLWFKALKKTDAWRVAALLSLSPIAGGALAFLWLGESLNTVQLIGAAIVLAASYKISVGRK